MFPTLEGVQCTARVPARLVSLRLHFTRHAKHRNIILFQPGVDLLPNVFFSYSHADEGLRDQLEKQLAMLKRQGVIETWHDRRIGAGQEIDRAIDDHIQQDEIILLLISPDFLASDYCYDIEMQRAMERHTAGDAIVIPVILRACDWHAAPFGKLLATPQDGKPVTQWPDRDQAFLLVAKAVRTAAARWQNAASAPVRPQSDVLSVVAANPARDEGASPRSSNLRLSKSFSQRDRDRFRDDTFEYIARYFENSLQELGVRNPDYEGAFRRVDANRFFATVYRSGKAGARATIFMGGDLLGRGINYVQGETMGTHTLNESLSVVADDQAMHLTSMGMMAQSRLRKLTQEGAAELLWSLLIEPLQQRGGSAF